jgi:hypothetical protein
MHTLTLSIDTDEGKFNPSLAWNFPIGAEKTNTVRWEDCERR